MLFCFGLFALLLYNTVVANGVCSFTYSKREKIDVVSRDYQKQGYSQCEYIIKAPEYTDVIELNFTDLIGFRVNPDTGKNSKLRTQGQSSWLTSTESLVDLLPSNADSVEDCLPPELIITEETLSERDVISNKICQTHQYKTPKVFHFKSHSLKIVYIWVRDEHSGFTLDIDFHYNKCAFFCDESKCLLDKSVVCNQVFDCDDQSDEQDCPASQTIGASQSIYRIVVIVVIVTLMPVLAVLICVVSPCRNTSRMWRRWRNRDRGDVENRQLRPRSSGSETGVTSLGTSTASHHDSLEQKVALLRERHILMQSAKSDMEIGLPPQIPISHDGEEGYVKSQIAINNYQSQAEVCQQFFRPPPNRIVYDIDSPPAYISRSVSSIESVGHAHLGTRGRLEMDPNNSCDVMLRCYSMPNNNNNAVDRGGLRTPSVHRPRHSHSKSDVQTVGLDRPPEYRQVVNIGVCNSSSNDKV